ncbi:MAG: cell division protein FtsW [Planctomycetota bacterium]|nr:MAG: cell division protein FtsW [Planctomycetota bacterium]
MPAFLAVVFTLLGFGLVLVYSASVRTRAPEAADACLQRHTFSLLLGAAIGTTTAFVPPRQWKRMAPALLVLTIALLALVLVPGVGARINGARRWFRVLGFSVQPSELAKLTVPMYVCSRLGGAPQRRDEWRVWLIVLPLALCVVGLVAAEPDLGTAAFLLLITGTALFAAGWPVRDFVLSVGLAAVLAMGLALLRDYQFERLVGFAALWRGRADAPYQLRQALLAIQSGGWWGRGLGCGVLKSSFLPESHNDFVYAVIGEELGTVGLLLVAALWLALYILGLRLFADRRRFSFSVSLGTTLLTALTLQAWLNMAVVTAIVPPKGIPLPLISYGGSSLVCSLAMIGIVIGLARSPDEGEHREHANSAAMC